jgi:hypothetical protein
MKKIEIDKATAPLSKYAREADKELETVTLSNNPKFLDLIEKSRTRQKSQGGISSKGMRHRLGLKKTTRSK